MNDFIVENLSKSVADKTVFKDISFIIHNLDRIGIIGVNGTGKTTLLDVLSERSGFDGDTSPFSKRNDYKIAYLTQDPEFDESKTVLDTVLDSDLREIELIRMYEKIMSDYTPEDQSNLEKIMTEMDALNVWSIESNIKTVLTKLGITKLSQKIKQLSGGMRRRVQLAQVLLQDADLLLLDEPTNHLDIKTIEWLTQFLINTKKTVLFITHDRYFLDNVATRIFELSNSQLNEYQGNYQDYIRLRAEQDERDAANRHKKKQLYKQELAWMRTQPQARATKQQARINRFQDLKRDVHQEVNNDTLNIDFETSRIGKKVINFENVSFAYDANKPILSDFNLIIQNKDRIGIVGDNGVGKSTLLNLITGELSPSSGKIDIGETVKIGYFSQQIKDMDEDKRVISYLQEIADEVKTSVGTTSVSELLEQFLFPRSTHGTKISKLSGGEKKRLYLLKILIEKPNVLLLDEPTNDLDIATLTVLEHFLAHFNGPIITVSHDRYFLDKVANKILAFEKDGIAEFYGNYTDYLDEQDFLNQNANLIQKNEATQKSETKSLQKKMSYFEKKEWATIEDTITDIEKAISVIEASMLEVSDDYDKLLMLQKELDEKNDELLEQYDRYEYLSQLIE